MASFKAKFRPSAVSGREGAIFYRITYRRRVCQVGTAYRIFPAEWDETQGRPVATVAARRPFIRSVREGMGRDMERLARIERRLQADDLPYTAADIAEEYERYATEYTLFGYMERIMAGLRAAGRIRTAETYRAAMKSFAKSRDGEDIMLDEITPETMEAYQNWMSGRGLIRNTVSFYMRILRAVYNRAVRADIIADRRPFRNVYTGVGRTVKRALPLACIRRIKNLNLSGSPALDYARDMFLMSFLLRGMSFVDMAFLHKTDLQDGHIIYRRRKTGRELIIGWTREMRCILDKYPENPSCFLLPIIREPEERARKAYRRNSYKINHALKEVGRRIGLVTPLTLYVARHSWASAARAKGIPLSVISEGMGHESEATTRIYLASLDTATIDRANRIIIEAIK